MEPRALYIHVPFCARRCSYCDFAVEATREPPVSAWLKAVASELAMVAVEQHWEEPLTLDTIYVGGGTPSLLGTGVMADLRAAIEPHAVLAVDGEWTCEANPESFDSALATDWREAGVNRISLGAQSFDPTVLHWMGRLHGPEGPERAVDTARSAGFADISVDLIFGVPARLGRDWDADLAKAVELGTEHISLYGLTAESGAPLGRWVAEGREALASDDRYSDEYLLAHRRLTDAGFVHYEVSNFARPGRRSRHNSVYWTGAPYVALGPGAHAFFPPERRWNLRSWSAYRETVEAGHIPVDARESIGAEESALESVWLRLRTDTGLDLSGLAPAQRQRIEDWVSGGLARIVDDVVRLTPTGWLLLDELAVALHEVDRESRASRSRRSIDDTGDLVQIGANSNPLRR